MATVNLSLGQLFSRGCTPEEILANAQALEAAGYQVNLQVGDPTGMKLLEQLPAVRTAKQRPPRLSLLSLIFIGTLGGLTFIVIGWMGV